MTDERDAVPGPELLAEGAIPLARALRSDPQNAAWLAALDELIERAGSADVVAPLVDDTPFEIAAVHARALRASGRTAEALLLLVDVARCAPEVPFLGWAEGWLDAVDELDDEQIARAGKALADVATPRAGVELHPVTGRVALELLSALALRHPGRSELSLLASVLFRRLGDAVQAGHFATSAYRASPGWLGAIHVAAALASGGDLAGAASWYERAIAADGREPSSYVDLADVLLDDGEFSRAADAYQDALARGADPSWCEASLLLCRQLGGEQASALDELRALAQVGSARAAELVELIDAPPYVERLPAPYESVARSVAQAIDALSAAAEGEPVKLEVRVPRLPAPSLTLALSVALARLGRSAELELALEAVGEPDPRLPRDEVPIWLWEYDDTTPRAALPQPSDRVRDLVTQLALEDYSLDRWWTRARDAAVELGPDAARDVLACMVHIPLPPPPLDAIAWVQRLQLAAALIVARLDESWEGSVRRALLLALARGPMDWAISASVVALFAVARETPSAVGEVTALFAELFALVPADDEPCYLHALTSCWLALGTAPPELVHELWRQRRALDRVVRTVQSGS